MNQPDLSPALRYRYVVCLCTFLGYIMVYFHRVCPTVIALDMQADFAASGALLGLLGSAYFWAYGAMQFPTGVLVDTWGARKTVTASLLVSAAGAVLMGLAPNLGLAVAGRVVVGAGVATVFVSNYKLLSEWFDARGFVRMGGFFQAMGGVGALTAGYPLAFLSQTMGWRMALVVVGLATVVLAAFFYALVRNRPQEKGWPALAPAAVRVAGEKVNLGAAVRMVVKTRGYWLLSAWAFFCGGLSFSMGGLWGGPYLMQVYHLSKAETSGVVIMYAVALAVGAPILSWIANRWGRKPAILVTGLSLLASFVVMWAGKDTLPMWVLSAVFFLLCVGGAAGGALQAAVSKELFPLNIAGTAMGLVNIFPFVGAGAMQVVMGAILAAYAPSEGAYNWDGYSRIFLLGIAGSVLGCLAGLLLPETLDKPAPKRG